MAAWSVVCWIVLVRSVECYLLVLRRLVVGHQSLLCCRRWSFVFVSLVVGPV